MIVSVRRILFPTDFSEPARHAQKYATTLAEKFGAELHVIHVVPEVIMPATDTISVWTLPEGSMKAQVDSAEQQLIAVAGADAIRCVTVGFPVEEIMKYAKEHDIDLLVVGTHGHTGLSHLLLGSVAEKLVRLASCPVLTVHPTGHQFVVAGS
ncbi:MAG: universal stress protein [Planctomycetes bacterium]|nr:universal stress protein [Planctomycetota bacterium]